MLNKLKTLLVSSMLFALSLQSMSTVEAATKLTINDMYPSSCGEATLFQGVRDLGTATINGRTVYSAAQFNSSHCNAQRRSYYGSQTFYRQNHGEVTIYNHIPTPNLRSSDNQTYTWDTLYEMKNGAYNGASFKYWATKMNSLLCGSYNANPIPCADTIDPHTYKTITYGKNGAISTGTSGEPRYLGYSSAGYALDNTYLPPDVANESRNTLNKYLAASDNDVFSTGGKYQQAKTKFDDEDMNGKIKRSAIEDLKSNYGITVSTDALMNKLSLKTDPRTDAAVFVATRENGAYYMVMFLPTPEEYRVKNVALAKVEIKKGDEVYAVLDRSNGEYPGTVQQSKDLEEGESYDIWVTVKNTEDTSLNSKTNYVEAMDKEYSNGSNLKPNTSHTFKIPDPYTVPEETQMVTIPIKVGSSYGDDNQLTHDDQGDMKLRVELKPRGNIAVKDAHLIEAKTGKEVEYPIQGVEYQIHYDLEYSGDKMPNEYQITLDAKINLYEIDKSNGSLKDSVINMVATTDNEFESLRPSDSKDVVKLVAKTETFIANTSKISTVYTLEEVNTDDKVNENKDDDQGMDSWEGQTNIKVTGLTLEPNKRPSTDYCGPVVFKYTLRYITPEIYNYHEAQTVNVKFTLGNEVRTHQITIYANIHAAEYFYNFEGACFTGEGDLPAKVEVNHDFELAESEYDDNDKETTWALDSVPADYCKTDSNTKTSHQWKQYYWIKTKGEADFSDNINEFESNERSEIDQSERYEITSIKLHSKYMEDKNMGTDGWVETIGDSAETPIIKAGYGFDAIVTVEYETDAFTTEQPFQDLIASDPNKQLFGAHALSEFEGGLFIELAGKEPFTLSVDIEQSTPKIVKGIDREKAGSERDLVTWTYTLKARPTTNGDTVDKIMISENTPDTTPSNQENYKIKFYTAPITGLINKTKNDGQGSTYGILCDYKEIPFIVKGSIYDDIKTGTIE